MYVRCSFNGDSFLIYVPETEKFEFRQRMAESRDSAGLYLILSDKEIQLKSVDEWCSGRPELPVCAVYELYSGIIDTASEILSEKGAKTTIINIDEIEDKLLEEQFYNKWVVQGYAQPDDNGIW